MTTHPDAFPWLQHLDADDLTVLVDELREDLAADDNTIALHNLTQTLHAWQVTAGVLADPKVRAELTNKELPGDTP